MQMDICSHIGLAVDVNSLPGFCVDTLESAYGVLGNFSIDDELGYEVTNFMNIQDDREEPLGSIPPHEDSLFQRGDVFEEAAHQGETTTGPPEKLLSKCVSVARALTTEINDYADDITNEISMHDDDGDESFNQDYSDSLSTPVGWSRSN